MTQLRKTIFISDLHLDANHPEIVKQFVHLLNECDASVDALYILGDLFEAWIGDDDQNDFHRYIIHALKSATAKGLKVYLMHGNRDFLIGKKFLSQTGCELLPDEKLISLYGIPTLLMHGDTLCTNDVQYLKARKLGHNKLLQTLFLLLPLSYRKHIAAKMRRKSMQHTQSSALEIMDVTDKAVENVIHKHQASILIHGHTHRPAEHLVAHTRAKRIVLGAWHDGKYVLVWNELGQHEIVKN